MRTLILIIATASMTWGASSKLNQVELHRLRNVCKDPGYNCSQKPERKSVLVFRCGEKAYIGIDFWNHQDQIYIDANWERTRLKYGYKFDYRVNSSCKTSPKKVGCQGYEDSTKKFSLEYPSKNIHQPGAPVEVKRTTKCPANLAEFSSKPIGNYVGLLFYNKL